MENTRENHDKLTQEIIDLANAMAERGANADLVSASLMSASAIYATFANAGNEGYLEESGIEKVTEVFKQQLEHIQKVKKALAEQQDQ